VVRYVNGRDCADAGRASLKVAGLRDLFSSSEQS
jgi:hypothetical protein